MEEKIHWVVVTAFRLPAARRRLLDQLAAQAGVTRSIFLRRVVELLGDDPDFVRAVMHSSANDRSGANPFGARAASV